MFRLPMVKQHAKKVGIRFQHFTPTERCPIMNTLSAFSW